MQGSNNINSWFWFGSEEETQSRICAVWSFTPGFCQATQQNFGIFGNMQLDLIEWLSQFSLFKSRSKVARRWKA